jgi:hypothetical protein
VPRPTRGGRQALGDGRGRHRPPHGAPAPRVA